MWLGLGYRAPLARWIHSKPKEIQCLEIVAEHFFDHPESVSRLKPHYPLLMHGLGLSLGTPGGLDQNRLRQFTKVCQYADPLWVSEHIAFTRCGDVDLGHLNPVPYTRETLAYMVDHVEELKQACAKPVLLENITSHLKLSGTMSEPEFINQLCEQAQCHLLLDVTNLYVNSRNHGFDVQDWLRQINPDLIRQLHIVGYSYEAGKFYDSHSQNIQQELFALTSQLVDMSPVKHIIIERDNNFPPKEQLRRELLNLERCYAA